LDRGVDDFSAKNLIDERIGRKLEKYRVFKYRGTSKDSARRL